MPIKILISDPLAEEGVEILKKERRFKVDVKPKLSPEELKKIIPCVKILVLFDTLKYLAKGGRIGKAKAFLGSVLNVKPILTIKDDEFVPVGQVRSRSKGIEKLFSFIEDTTDIQDLAVIYSTTPEEAKSLADRATQIIPKEKIMMARLGPALGVHGGPGVLAVAIRGLS